VGRLVAVDADRSQAFVSRLRQAWDAGDAVLPVDPRIPGRARAALLTELRAGDTVDAGDALVVATSGSTGRPKGVVLTHEAVRASVDAVSARLGVEPASDRWLCCLPLSHLGGLSVVTRAVLTGTPLTFDDGDGDATLVSLVPTQLLRMDVGRFRAVVLGGQAPPADLPPNVVTTYGMTETGSGVVYDGVPLDGVEIRIGAGGRIFVRGPMLLRCYRDGADPKDGGGWLDTGDAGALGADGRLGVHGRLSELIVTGGENVWPAPVEAVLRRHPSVADAAVVGRPDPSWGERVVALVVPASGADPPSLSDLRAAVKESLPPWCAPKDLELVDALPRTALGKLYRAALG